MGPYENFNLADALGQNPNKFTTTTPVPTTVSISWLGTFDCIIYVNSAVSTTKPERKSQENGTGTEESKGTLQRFSSNCSLGFLKVKFFVTSRGWRAGTLANYTAQVICGNFTKPYLQNLANDWMKNSVHL